MHQKVALLADEGSGTTLLRRYLELITGIATGSDVTPDCPVPLSALGLIGEHNVGNFTWITRTTYPIRKAQSTKKFMDFECNKLIVLARNPADVIETKLHQFITGTKSKRATFSRTEHEKFMDDFISNALEEANAVY